jgi:flagellar protein FliS
MYATHGYAAASRRYAAVETGSKVEGATPHQLVKILFDELLLALDASVVAARADDRRKALDKQTRALAILHALETSLDFERGGDIATSLAIIYREARRLTLGATQSHAPEPMIEARRILAEIADAWGQIG